MTDQRRLAAILLPMWWATPSSSAATRLERWRSSTRFGPMTLRDIGVRSHYVGDASQPLHVSVQWLGQVPEPAGVHQGPHPRLAAGADKIALATPVFTQAGPVGPLWADAYFIGTAAHDASDRIIYNSAKGKLLYDPDGAGGLLATQFASVLQIPALSAGDFKSSKIASLRRPRGKAIVGVANVDLTGFTGLIVGATA